jgi:hypothetical protein
MKRKSKSKPKAQWKLPPTQTTTLAAKSFEGFSHEPSCSCNKKTGSFLNKALHRLDFLQLKCPFDSGHDVVIPRGLDSQNDQDRIAALDNYAELERKLNDAGLSKNADQVHDCIHEYLDHGLNGKIFFHPVMEEVPFGLLTKKQQKAHMSQLAEEAQAKVKAFIPTLPKNAMITVLTNDPEIKDGVAGWVGIQDDGSVSTGAPLPKGETADKYLEYLLFRGLFFSTYGTGMDYIAVVKTAADVKYIRLFDESIFELEPEVGKKFAMNFLKYRGKSFADIFARGNQRSLPKNRMMFYIAFIEKNNVLKGGLGKKAA